MKILRPAIFSSLCLFSCSSLTKSKLSWETDLFVDYVKASGLQAENPQEACRLFYNLSNNSQFILKDVAYVRAAKNCTTTSEVTIDWSRPVPSWVDGEKKLLYFNTLTDDLKKGLFVKENTSLFKTPERIAYYQKALGSKDISAEDKKTLETALYSLSPRFMAKPTESDFLRIAKDYRSVRMFQKSYDYLNKIVKSSKTSREDKMLALKELFTTHKLNRLRDKKGYINAAKKWATFLKPKDLEHSSILPYHYEANVNLARVLWTEQGTTEALNALDRTEKILTGRNSLFDIYWLRGRIYEEQKKSEEAQAQFIKATNEVTPNWKEKEKIIWSLTWSFFKTKNFKKAVEYLDSMISAPEISTPSRFKYLYWKGEAFQRDGMPKEARAIWESLAEEDTYGYYGLLAHHQVDKPLDTFTSNLPESTSVLSNPEAKIFNALIKVEEMDLAQRMLVEKMADDTKVLQMSVEDICALFVKLSQVNSYSSVFNYFVNSPTTHKNKFFIASRKFFSPVLTWNSSLKPLKTHPSKPN